MLKENLIFTITLLGIAAIGYAQMPDNQYASSVREHILMDFGWRFAYGHASDFSKDFYHRTSDFTHFAKSGYGDGAAAPGFEDRAWREIDLPHDWAAELPFASAASHTHGYRTIGWQYPETSVGWYRKRFTIPASDFGRKISLQFDGIYRNAAVWVNGFYLGTEQSGYASTGYDITDYLNYGGENVVAVRVDASIEEGWFYEGAGIYRHVWLNKTSGLHVAQYGTFVTTAITDSDAQITIRTHVENQQAQTSTFSIVQTVLDANGQPVLSRLYHNISLLGNRNNTYYHRVTLENPNLWSLDNPYLYTLETRIIQGEKVVDCYHTPFGIRTVRFDPDLGFFLNGKNVKIKGVNNHQDHAGVGVAIPDGLQEYRVLQLKEMGCNAIRTSHNPPTPELLDICDRLGILVINENRLMGINREHLNLLKRLIVRDRNHPCVVLWSLGNEEWYIEGNEKGALITKTMQEYAQILDSSRACTVAISGGWDWGSGTTAQVMGYNYIVHGSIDGHHKKFPWQPAVGTEETNTIGTRGCYTDDRANGHMAAIQHYADSTGTEYGWKYYLARPFLAGLFFWTGFDYHGEPHPLYWPQVNSQFGILDLCGFPKDIYYYLQSWWTEKPVLHMASHWNWKGREGQAIKIPVYSNCDEVELFLNRKSLGKRSMPRNGHIDWEVAYQPGVLLAKGYSGEKQIVSQQIETSGLPARIALRVSKDTITANGRDVSIINVRVNDVKDRFVPTANPEITLTLTGPGKIIGVGNGDPASHDPEQYIESVKQLYLSGMKYKMVDPHGEQDQIQVEISSGEGWRSAFENGYGQYPGGTVAIFKGSFHIDDFDARTTITFYAKSLAANQSIYINGTLIGKDIQRHDPAQVFVLDHKFLRKGVNEIAFVGVPFVKQTQWEEINTNPGTIKVHNPAPQWRCKVFNGLAQVIVRATSESGRITVEARSEGLETARIQVTSR